MHSLPMVVTSCGECAFREECGGLPGQQVIGGCFARCGVECGGPAVCKWICPAKPSFVDDEREVQGLRPRLPRLHALARELPSYVPVICHGSSREGRLAHPVVALSIQDIFSGGGRGSYGAFLSSSDSLRDRFRLEGAVDVLVVSVARDAVLEKFWALHDTARAIEKLSAANVVAVTVPNFSSFDDAPRTYTLWNRRRMEIVAEELTRAGIAVVPHLNSAQREDWDYWFNFMSASAGLKFIAKEFRTGLRRVRNGRKALYELADLQQRLGRELHPILVAGAQYAAEASRHFTRVTVVDSQPFMKTMMRHRGTPTGTWYPSPRSGPLDELLEENISAHSMHIAHELRRSVGRAA